MKAPQTGKGAPKRRAKSSAAATKQPRYNFSSATKAIIAGRANYECVVPGCKLPTKGPGAASGQVSSQGWACHIYSAAKDGPRGQAGWTKARIEAPENGVWCCPYHGTLIDNNQGDRYPAPLLLGWRALQEAELTWRADHQATHVGWIESLVVQNSFLFAADAKLPLGKCTLLHGDSHGKTALCDWLAAAVGTSNLWRWKVAPGGTIATVNYYAPNSRALELTIANGIVTRTLNGRNLVESTPDLAVVMVPEGFRAAFQEDLADDALIGRILGVDVDTVAALVGDINRHGTSFGRRVSLAAEREVPDDDGDGEAQTGVGPERNRMRLAGVALQGLSGSEQTRLVLEFAMALARGRSNQRPTVLILDSTDWTFDARNWAKYAAFLPGQPYQTLITRPEVSRSADLTPWHSWTRIGLEGDYKNQHSGRLSQESW